MSPLPSLLHTEWSQDAQAELRTRLTPLLAKQVRMLTQGDSSSVPYETAEALLESVCYTLRLHLDLYALPDETLMLAPLETLFAQAQKTLERVVMRAHTRYDMLSKRIVPLESLSLQSTMAGAGAFFRQYDWRLFAQEDAGDIDYQLCLPIAEPLHGVRFVLEYLRRLGAENELLACFPLAGVRRVLNAFQPEWSELLVNLYEPIAVNLLGASLLGLSMLPDVLAPADDARLQALLRKPAEPLQNAAVQVAERLRLSDEGSAYLKRSAAETAVRIEHAQGSLSGIFTFVSARDLQPRCE